MLKYNLGEKFMKIPDIIYGDFECISEKISTCSNNPEKSSTTKLNKHTLLVFLYLLIFRLIQKKKP